MIIMIGMLGTDIKGLVQGQGDVEIRGRVETVKPTAVLRPVFEETQPPLRNHQQTLA